MNINDIALRFLEHRERSVWETKKHLKDKDFEEDEIHEAIKYLTELSYLDDCRFSEAYVRYSLKKGKASYRIKNELREKGVDSQTAEAALEKYTDSLSERENALSEAKKIMRKTGMGLEDEKSVNIDEKLKGKIGRRLAYLGYKTSVIYDVLNEL